jgi:signal transduction histidine kinase
MSVASKPSEPRRVIGRVDKAGRLIAADPELEALQREAGSALGKTLALPQVAAVVQVARQLGTPVSRPAIAASAEHDIELWVHATPEGDEVALSLEGWTVRAPAAPRHGSLFAAGEPEAGTARHEWAADEELRLISVSSDLADMLGIDVAQSAGLPLTRILRLEEDGEGDMPLISALAARRGFNGQRARSRADDARSVILSGEVVAAADGSFAGFRGTAEAESNKATPLTTPVGYFDHALDDVLRQPLDRIIESAERIVERADGPLRSDYASYGNDIAAAARHLLSVVRGMSEDPSQGQQIIDLTALSAEAVVMLESSAEHRRVKIEMEASEPLLASGQERAVIQIIVNLVVNAIRYSPKGKTVRLSFDRTDGAASITVTDEGPGVKAADQQRIFERFERAHSREEGAGLGLAISRRLARSMGGDVTLDSAPGEGARFTLTLPRA